MMDSFNSRRGKTQTLHCKVVGSPHHWGYGYELLGVSTTP